MRMLATTILVVAGACARGQVPVDPADMLHLLVSQSGQSLALEFETPVSGPVDLVRYSETYTGPGSVLNGRGYNAQFGWLASGFFDLPFGSGVFVEAQRVDRGLALHDAFTFDPILGTGLSADVWQWSGQMTHNWVSAARPGVYQADLLVYVGDGATGAPLAGWAWAEVTLAWELSWLSDGPAGSLVVSRFGPVPAPGSGVLVGMGLMLAVRRRR